MATGVEELIYKLKNSKRGKTKGILSLSQPAKLLLYECRLPAIFVLQEKTELVAIIFTYCLYFYCTIYCICNILSFMHWWKIS